MKKKTEILKFRIDIATLMTLQDACRETGRTISELLRAILDRELAGRQEGLGASPSEAEWSAALKSKDERAECARVLSSILVGPQPTLMASARLENWRAQQREVAALLESLFRAVESSRTRGKLGDRLKPEREYGSFIVSAADGDPLPRSPNRPDAQAGRHAAVASPFATQI